MPEQMNIYLINFTQHDAGLSAVVVADCRTSAENMINEQLGPEASICDDVAEANRVYEAHNPNHKAM